VNGCRPIGRCIPWIYLIFSSSVEYWHWIHRTVRISCLTLVDPNRKVPDLYFKVVDSKLQVADLKAEVGELRSGGIPHFNHWRRHWIYEILIAPRMCMCQLLKCINVYFTSQVSKIHRPCSMWCSHVDVVARDSRIERWKRIRLIFICPFRSSFFFARLISAQSLAVIRLRLTVISIISRLQWTTYINPSL